VDGAVNHLDLVRVLRNRYYAMRHGQSVANVRGIIVSGPERGRSAEFGLSALGREQAVTAAAGSGLADGTVIWSSDFSRAAQTALLVAESLGAAAAEVSTALRERWFGDFEGTPVANYETVWAADATDPGQASHGVEAASAVLGRATAFVAELESRYRDRDILLVSHGDTLQILQAGFLGLSPAGHREVPHLGTAEIRRLRRGEPGGRGGRG
jgi:probable phosphoglycerate mutase